MPSSTHFIITLDAVTAVRPGGEIAVRDLTWTISEGEIWVIAGPVGCGKSSLAEVLVGRHRVTAGTIRWPFLDGRGGWPAEVIRLVSFREQSHLFSPARHYYQQRFNFVEPKDDLTLEQYLRAGGEDVASVAERLHLTELLPLSFIALSTGQMRRARIAKALLAHPELLILDDPFVGLDAASREEITAMLGELVRTGLRLILICRADAVPEWVTHVLEMTEVGWVKGEKRARPTDSLARMGLAAAQIESLYTITREPIVEVRNVTVRYGDRVALRDVSWTVRAGERWAVIGPNGSGKTTLLSLLCGDHPQAYANDVRLFGQRRGSGESIWDIKRSIGLVSSELHVYYSEPLTAAETAATGFHDVLAYRRPTAIQSAAVRQLFGQFGIANLSGRRFNQLSTGQQRLVLLVRALVKRPPLLILDEPFQGMDGAMMERARDWLNDNLRPDQALIIVTHDPAEIPATVPRRLQLNWGRVSEVV